MGSEMCIRDRASTIANGINDPLIQSFNLSRFGDFDLVGEKGAAAVGH